MEPESSTQSGPVVNFTSDTWPKNWQPRTWIEALYRRFSLIYLSRFTASFQETKAIEEWCAAWAEGLSGLTGAQMAAGLSRTTRELAWPPSIAEFREKAESLVELKPCCRCGSPLAGGYTLTSEGLMCSRCWSAR